VKAALAMLALGVLASCAEAPADEDRYTAARQRICRAGDPLNATCVLDMGGPTLARRACWIVQVRP